MSGSWRTFFLGSLGAALLLLPAALARAAPVVAVDADPSTPGVQTTVTVPQGLPFDVDVVVSGVEAPQSVRYFEFQLSFDPLLLTPVAAVNGGFLPDEDLFFFDATLGASTVSVSAGLVGIDSGVRGSGTLARLTFAAAAPGSSPLDLHDVELRAPLSPLPLPLGGVEDGSATVTPAAAPVPSLSLRSAGLLAIGLGLALATARTPGRRPPPRSEGKSRHPHTRGRVSSPSL